LTSSGVSCSMDFICVQYSILSRRTRVTRATGPTHSSPCASARFDQRRAADDAFLTFRVLVAHGFLP
jgi:hypothetical protein